MQLAQVLTDGVFTPGWYALHEPRSSAALTWASTNSATGSSFGGCLAQLEAPDAADEQVADRQVEEAPQDVDRRRGQPFPRR
jgi:hypothetical protein